MGYSMVFRYTYALWNDHISLISTFYLVVTVYQITADLGLHTIQTFYYSSECQKSEMSLKGLKSRCGQDWLLFGGSREEFVPCLHQHLQAGHSWPVAT